VERMRKVGIGAHGGLGRRLAALAWAAASAGASHALEIGTGNPDLTLRVDNVVRYNLGVRAEKQDQKIVNNRNFDESDLKFGRGDIVTNRLDWFFESDLVWKGDTGIRLSGAAWYDHAYRDTTVRTNPALAGFVSSYNNNEYSSLTKRFYRGPSGEFLDAFAFTRFNLGETSHSVKLGQHAIVWGEGLLFGAHAISYNQNPVDGRKGAANPGAEVKELFLPVGQLSLVSLLTPQLTLSAQYFYDWKPNRLPEGGTYFAPSDHLFDGPDRLPTTSAGGFLPRLPTLDPERKRGDFGVSLRKSVPAIDSQFGVYFRKFDDRQPWNAAQTNVPNTPGYRLVYARDVKLLGASFSKVIAGVSTGVDLSYRKDAPLNSSSISAVDNQGARGNSWHLVINGVKGLTKTALYDSGTLTAELAFSHLDKVTVHPELFRGEGFAGCAARQDKTDGCSTRNFAGVAVNFNPQWFGVFPSVDLSMPVTLNYGLRGNGATLSGGNEKALTWSIGLAANVHQRHEISLRYADSYAKTKHAVGANGLNAVTGGNGNIGATDRGWVSLTLKTQF